jgi:hypothetical protein
MQFILCISNTNEKPRFIHNWKHFAVHFFFLPCSSLNSAIILFVFPFVQIKLSSREKKVQNIQPLNRV